MEDLARSAGMTVPTGPRCDVIPMFRALFAKYNGFSLHRSGQLARSNPAWQHLAQFDGLHVIHLHRRNMLDQYVSVQLAMQSGVWHHRTAAGSRRPEWAPFTIDVDDCIASMRNWRHTFEWALEVFQNQPHVVFTYEEIQDNIAAVLASCQAFLGIPVEPLPLRYQKLPAKDLQRLVANFLELNTAISETEFANCIAGDVVPQVI